MRLAYLCVQFCSEAGGWVRVVYFNPSCARNSPRNRVRMWLWGKQWSGPKTLHLNSFPGGTDAASWVLRQVTSHSPFKIPGTLWSSIMTPIEKRSFKSKRRDFLAVLSISHEYSSLCNAHASGREKNPRAGIVQNHKTYPTQAWGPEFRAPRPT